MKKQDLYDLIDKRHTERTKVLIEKYRKIASNYAAKLIKYYETDFRNIDKAVSTLKNVAAPTHFNMLFNYYGGFTSKINDIISYGSYYDHVTKVIITKYDCLRLIADQSHWTEFVRRLDRDYNQKVVVPYEKEIQEAKTLADELKNVVRLSSAKQAAKRLEELGLDLSDLEEIAVQNLPAVIKTSVDVCIFNKEGC